MAELILPSLEVKLECYQGPLFVLLNLIKRKRVSIWDVPLAEIVEEFLYYVESIREMNLRIAEDFIEVASMLIVLKSRMLLSDDGKDSTEAEILEKIYEYEKVRKLSSILDELPLLNRDTFTRKRDKIVDEEPHIYSLWRTFFEITRRTEEKFIEIIAPKPTLEEKILDLEESLKRRKIYVFDACKIKDLQEKVATILSMLEIVNRKIARIVQYRPFGRIILKRREE